MSKKKTGLAVYEINGQFYLGEDKPDRLSLSLAANQETLMESSHLLNYAILKSNHSTTSQLADLLSIQNMSLKVGTLDNKTSEIESSLVQDMEGLFRWNSILPPENVTISRHFYRTHIQPVLEDYQEALSRRRQHCKTVNELDERLSRENDKLKKILSAKEMKVLPPFPGKEKELCDIIESKLPQFCLDVLGESYCSHRREYTFGAVGFGPNRPKIDFHISCIGGDILLEVKNPINSGNEMRSAIGQSLSYLSLAKRTGHNIKRNVLLTTRTSIDVCETITDLNLPIELLIMEDERVLILTGIQK